MMRTTSRTSISPTIAVWNGKPSGTGKTVQYAQQQGKPVRVINPITLVVENI